MILITNYLSNHDDTWAVFDHCEETLTVLVHFNISLREGIPFVSSPKHGHWHSKEQRGAAPSKALPRILRNGTHHLIVGREVDKKKFQLSFPHYHPHHLCGETPVFQTFQAVLFLYRLDLLVGRHKSWQVGWDLRSEQDISCLSRQPSMQQCTPPSNVDVGRSFPTCHQHSKPAAFFSRPLTFLCQGL